MNISSLGAYRKISQNFCKKVQKPVDVNFYFDTILSQDTRHKTQDTRHKTQDTRHKTQDTRHKTQDTSGVI